MNRKTAIVFLCVYIFLTVVVWATANWVHAEYWEVTSMGMIKMVMSEANGVTRYSWHDVLREEVSTQTQEELQRVSIVQGELVRCVPWLNKTTRYCYFIRYEPSFTFFEGGE